MKNKVEITELIQIFDYEFDNTTDWWNVHINTMYNEANEVRNAFKIFKSGKGMGNKGRRKKSNIFGNTNNTV